MDRIILTNTAGGASLTGSGDSLFVAEGATLYKLDDLTATVVNFLVPTLHVQVEGTVFSGSSGAIVLYADGGVGDHTVLIGAEGAAYADRDYVSVFSQGSGNFVQNLGQVSGGAGIWGENWSGGRIENEGTIAGQRYAAVKLFDGTGPNIVINGGLITGQGGVVLQNATATVINTAGGEIRSNAASVAAVDASAAGAAGLRLRNDGEIVAGDADGFVATAVAGSVGADRVVNKGHMDGNVLLGGGNDLFNGRRGTVDGAVRGGDGNDIIFSGVGDDALYGDFGADWLEGGAGDDLLYGGPSRDVFVFGRGNGNDVVADFQDAADDLDLSLLRFASFAAVSALATNVTGGLLLDLTSRGGGTIFVQGLAKAQFDATDVVL